MVQGHQAVTRLAQALALLSLAIACASSKETSTTPGAGGEAGENSAAPEPGGAGGSDENAGGADTTPPVVVDGAFYAESVESFEPGEAAGYNQDELPGVVLGPPRDVVEGSGSLDVLSLGSGGEIVLGFGERGIADGPGPDFVVFENPFWPGDDESQVFAELGEVAVSEDGKRWHAFPCDGAGDGAGHFPGCAGVTRTREYDPRELVPLDPQQSGGDAFDLADLGLLRARFVRVRDLKTLPPGGVTSGFDLDAVGVIHAEQ